GGAKAQVELTNAQLHRPNTASTFHGRDVFGPVAAHLSFGLELEALGKATAPLSSPLAWPKPQQKPGAVIGHIVHVDAYGNLVTSLSPGDLPKSFELRIARRKI